MTDLEQIYARTFSGTSGKRVLEHLRKITIERALGPDADDAHLGGEYDVFGEEHCTGERGVWDSRKRTVAADAFYSVITARGIVWN